MIGKVIRGVKAKTGKMGAFCPKSENAVYFCWLLNYRLPFGNMRHGLPSTFDTGRVQSVASYQLHTLGRDMLCNLCQEVTGLEHMNVFLEIHAVMGMKENPTLKPFIVDLLQGYRRPGQILGKVLPGSPIENPYAVVYTEA